MDPIIEFKSKINLKEKTIEYLKIIFLPLLLAVLFVIQNVAFNWWLDIYSRTYFFRLIWVSFALGVVFYGPALLFKRKYKYWYLIFISFLVSVILTAEFLYYKYSQSFLQFSAVRYLTQADSLMGTVKILLTPELLLFFSNLAIAIVAYIISAKIKIKEFVLPNWEKVIIVLVMIAIVFFGYKYLLYTEKKEWGDTSRLYKDVYDLRSVVGKMGVVNFFLEDTFKYVKAHNLVSADDVKFLQNWEKNRTPVQTGSAEKYFGVERKGKIL